jgi:MSHA biogenesis protein MshN
MKLSTLLALGQPPAPPVTRPVPAVAKPAATETAKPAPPPREIKPAATAETRPENAQIDRRTRGDQGRDLAEIEYRKAMQAAKRGDNPMAQPLLQRALELDPRHAKARQALLSVLVGSKQWAEALQVAKSGLELDPAQSGWAVILARLQFEQGDAAAAVETLGRHAASAGGDADYQGLFAYLLQKQQRPAEAAERFKAALNLRPNEGRWWFGLGLALEATGRGGEAKEAYAQAREAGNLPSDMATAVDQKLR